MVCNYLASLGWRVCNLLRNYTSEAGKRATARRFRNNTTRRVGDFSMRTQYSLAVAKPIAGLARYTYKATHRPTAVGMLSNLSINIPFSEGV